MTDRGKARSLTLELSGPMVTAERFSKGVRAFSTLIEEVATDFSGRANCVTWVVTVESCSTQVSFSPEPVSITARRVPQLLDFIHAGLETVELSSTRPPHFTDKALQAAGDLAAILDAADGEVDIVRIWKDDQPQALTARTVTNVDSLLRGGSEDWGSVEGRLSMVSELDGFHFIVVDPLTDQPITCRFPENLLGRVIRAFGKRVSVSGLIRYRGNGEIVSVEVDEFNQFPNSGGLPGFMDVYGILGGK